MTGVQTCALPICLYDPLKEWIFRLSRRMLAIQAGSIHAYLAYIFVTLILLLLFGVRPW